MCRLWGRRQLQGGGQEDEAEVSFVGARTLEERNAAGFAAAIVLDEDEDEREDGVQEGCAASGGSSGRDASLAVGKRGDGRRGDGMGPVILITSDEEEEEDVLLRRAVEEVETREAARVAAEAAQRGLVVGMGQAAIFRSASFEDSSEDSVLTAEGRTREGGTEEGRTEEGSAADATTEEDEASEEDEEDEEAAAAARAAADATTDEDETTEGEAAAVAFLAQSSTVAQGGRLQESTVDTLAAARAECSSIKGKVWRDVISSRVVVAYDEGDTLVPYAGTVVGVERADRGSMLVVCFDGDAERYEVEEGGEDEWEWEEEAARLQARCRSFASRAPAAARAGGPNAAKGDRSAAKGSAKLSAKRAAKRRRG